MLDKLKEKLFGERKTTPCVCGGEMVKHDVFPPNHNPCFRCEDCGSWSDGVVFHPSEEFEKTEECKEWRRRKQEQLRKLT